MILAGNDHTQKVMTWLSTYGASEGRTASALLRREKASGKQPTKPGKLLLSNSAAEGLLWSRRGLQLWFQLFANYRANTKFVDQARQAYRQTIEPFNGFVMRNLVGVNMALAPSWQSVLAAGNLCDSPEELEQACAALAESGKIITERLIRLHTHYGLEETDKR